MNMTIRDNYQHVLERIDKAAKLVGRNLDNIRLVVVTKTQPIVDIEIAIEAGALDLGENYIEDAIPKINTLGNNKGIKWHMIGHVQSRKALFICEYFNYLHSLDSLKLAEKLSRYLVELNRTLPVWLEFNISGEESKSGWNIWKENYWDEILPDIEKILALPRLKLLGVMAIPPYSADPEGSRPYFRKLRKFQEFIINHYQLNDFRELSIGMSGDFEIAVQEGSTCVRIGQAIFGPRLR
jgi:pyridoxal phosphate enzyme (YggS family)